MLFSSQLTAASTSPFRATAHNSTGVEIVSETGLLNQVVAKNSFRVAEQTGN